MRAWGFFPFRVPGPFVLKTQASRAFLLLDGLLLPRHGRVDRCFKKQYKEYIFLLKTS